MSNDFLASEEFASLTHRHIQECIELMLNKNESFEILVNMYFVDFNPPLPENIKNKKAIGLFSISSDSLDSAKVTNNSLIFDAAFGDENFITSVRVNFNGILRINIQETTLLINCSTFIIPLYNASEEIQKSTDIFKSNPKNKDIFKS